MIKMFVAFGDKTVENEMGSRSLNKPLWMIVGLAVFLFLRNGEVGRKAPDFSLQGVYGGSDYHLNSFQGKSVLLVFWTTGCGVCRRELPILNGLRSDAARSNAEIACVNIGDMDGAREVMRPLRLRLNLVDLDGSAARSYGVSGVPKLLLIGPDGKIKWTASGLQSEQVLRQHLTGD
jgi:peroxiredoxin